MSALYKLILDGKAGEHLSAEFIRSLIPLAVGENLELSLSFVNPINQRADDYGKFKVVSITPKCLDVEVNGVNQRFYCPELHIRHYEGKSHETVKVMPIKRLG